MADKITQDRKQKSKKQKIREKKNYRVHQNKHNEAKEQWKKKVIYSFNKEKRKKQPAGIDFKKLYEEMTDSDEEPQETTVSGTQASTSNSRFAKKKETSRFSRAQREYQKKAEKKRQKYEETMRRKKEKEAALEQYRTKKKQKYLHFCKRTSKGQPVMKYQMQYLVQKLEREYKQSTQESGS